MRIDFHLNDLTDLGIARVLAAALSRRDSDLAVVAERDPERDEVAAALAGQGVDVRPAGRFQQADAVLATKVADAGLDRWRGAKLLVADGCAPVADPHGHVTGIDAALVSGRHARASLAPDLALERIAMIAHPRLASLLRGEQRRDSAIDALGLDPRRKTVALLTALDTSLGPFASAIERLARTHQVITYGASPTTSGRGVGRVVSVPSTGDSTLVLAAADVSLAAVRSRFLGDAILAGGITVALSAGDAVSDRVMPQLLRAAPVCTSPDELGRLIDELLFDDVYVPARAELARLLFEPFAGRADDAAADAILAMLERIERTSLVGAGA